MSEKRARRKLSGILSADAVGYSRLMREDEASTIRNLKDSKKLMSNLIEQFKGRVVDSPGDNLLAEFGSVVDATECAVKIQQELKTKNAQLPDSRRMQFRIGVNLGDVVEEADRIYGDGVNIAAGGLIGWNIYLQLSKKIEPASLDKMEYPLPDKPSIAVLPFDNMSADPKQEYLCDGIAEEIITALSKTPKLFVIARNSTFTYKGKPVKAQQVAEELGVRFVLEGSVRRDSERVRVTAQLIDAINGIHLWAERYDRDLKDIFAIQDDITKRIVSSLQVKLTIGEASVVYAKGTNNLDAYLKVMQAWVYHMKFTKEDNLISRGLAEEGISMDPQYGSAYVLLAATYMLDTFLGDVKFREQNLGKAIEIAKKAVALNYPGGYAMLGWLYSLAGQDDKAIAECKKALELDPNSSLTRAWYGAVLYKVGEYEGAVEELEQAVRRDPMAGTWVLRFLGLAYSLTGRHDEAITTIKKAIQKAPNDYISRLTIIRAYIFAGRQEEAEVEAAEVLRLNPKFTLENYAKTMTGKDKERSLEALRRAGLK